MSQNLFFTCALLGQPGLARKPARPIYEPTVSLVVSVSLVVEVVCDSEVVAVRDVVSVSLVVEGV